MNLFCEEHAMEEHQVIIVGAGPAGSACARALKQEDIDVLVIDSEALPRNKICSGILFGQTQVLLEKYFGALPPESMYCEPKVIRAADIRQWTREKGFSDYVWELSKDGETFPQDYYNIWRRDFDFWLLQQSGAPFRKNCMLQSFSAQDGGIALNVLQREKLQVDAKEKDKAEQKFRCGYLVGADGGSSRIRKALDPSGNHQENEIVIFQAYYRYTDLGSLKENQWSVFFEPRVGEMLSCVHKKDDVLTLCVGGFKGRNLKQSMEVFMDLLKQEFNVVFGSMERVEGCLLRPPTPFFGTGRVLLTGEAAGMMYLNGEGISAAIDSGYCAGRAIARAIKDNADAQDTYVRETASIVNHIKTCTEQMHFLTM